MSDVNTPETFGSDEATEKSAFAARRFEGKDGAGRHILGALLILGLWVILTALLVVPLTLMGSPEFLDIMSNQKNWVDITPEEDHAALVVGFVILASIIILLPAIWIIVRLVNRRSLMSVVTAHERFRWGSAAKGFLIFALAMVLASVILSPFAATDLEYIFEPERFWLFLPLVLLLTPIQAFTEEVFVRGYLFQTISSFTASLIARLVLPAILFSLLHAANSDFWAGGVWAILSYFGIGVYFGWLTIKTDGVEHASGIHTANNIAAFTIVSSAGAGMPFATVYFEPNPDYRLGFVSLILTIAIHYAIAFKVLKS